MNIFGLILLSWWCLVTTLADDSHVESEQCPKLTEEGFEAHLDAHRKNQRPSFVMFHVPWCKACQRAYPQFVDAAEQSLEKGLPMDWAHVDCESQKNLCKRFGVKGYPTIKLFEVKKDTDDPRAFKSQRTLQGFLDYADRMTQAPVRESATREIVNEALKNESFAAIVAVVDEKAKVLPAGLLAVADMWRDRHRVLAAKTGFKELLPQDVLTPKDATLAVFSSPEQQWSGQESSSSVDSDQLAPRGPPAVAFYFGSLDNSSALSAWVVKNRFPGVWRLGESSFFEFTHASRSAAVVAINPNESQVLAEEELRRCAHAMGEEYIFGVVDGIEWSESLGDFNILKQGLPRVFITEDDFEVWIEDVEALRVLNLETDLKAIVSGAPILRQSRTTWSKVQFYHREASRKSEEIRYYAARGWTEAAIVIGVLALCTVILYLMCWGLKACCRELLTEDYDYPPPRLPAQKRD